MTVNELKRQAQQQLIEDQKTFRCIKSTSYKVDNLLCVVTIRSGNIRYNHLAYTFYADDKKISAENLKKIIG